MLASMHLANFKPFGDRQNVELAPITLVYGPNSTGKSSLIQALLLLRQSLGDDGARGRYLLPRGPYVDLGNFKSLVHRHETDRTVSLGFGFKHPKLNRRARDVSHPTAPVGARFEFEAGPRRGARLSRIVYQVGLPEPGPLACALERVEGQKDLVGGGDTYVPVGDEALEGLARLARRWTRDSDLPAGSLTDMFRQVRIQAGTLLPERLEWVSRTGLDTETPAALRAVEGTLTPLAAELRAQFESISYLGPLRQYPERFSFESDEAPDHVGIQGEYTATMLFRQPEMVMQSLVAWFERFEIPYSLKVHRTGDAITGDMLVLTLVDRRTGVRVSPRDVGFGIGQFLPILVEGQIARGRIICVEQPEIHLHPRLQAHLADFFIETGGLMSSDLRDPDIPPRNQWILETHSEALMLRFQRRIREGKIHPDDVAVLYVESAGESGSRVVRLRLDEEGDFIDEWPDGFFEETYHELFGPSL